MFDVPRLNFNPLLLNAKSIERIQLMNKDHIPVSFNFSQDSVRGDNRYQNSLTVSPMSGVVGPNTSLPIEITFKPKVEGTYNYNLICNVKRKIKPLNINLKGVGFNLHHKIEDDQNITFDEKILNVLKYGEIYIKMKKIRIIKIHNKGLFNFDFNFSKRIDDNYIQISPDKGTVESGKSIEVNVVIEPEDIFDIKSDISLEIISGPKYNIKLEATVKKPLMKFNNYKFDFGYCAVTKHPVPNIKTLSIYNNDQMTMQIESSFVRKP